MVAPTYCVPTPRRSHRDSLPSSAKGNGVVVGAPERDKDIRERLLALIICEGGLNVPYKGDETLRSWWVSLDAIHPSSVVRRPPKGLSTQTMCDDALEYLMGMGIIERQGRSVRLSPVALSEIIRTGLWRDRPWDAERLPKKSDTRSSAWTRKAASCLLAANFLAA